jgi:hypothetical protein
MIISKSRNRGKMTKSRKRRKGRNKERDIRDRINDEKQGRSERRRKNAESQEKTCYQLVNFATERLRKTGSNVSQLC